MWWCGQCQLGSAAGPFLPLQTLQQASPCITATNTTRMSIPTASRASELHTKLATRERTSTQCLLTLSGLCCATCHYVVVAVSMPTLLLLLLLLLLQVFINNAGICVETFSQAIADISTKTLAETFSVNVYGPILVTQQLLKQVSLTRLLHYHKVVRHCGSVVCT